MEAKLISWALTVMCFVHCAQYFGFYLSVSRNDLKFLLGEWYDHICILARSFPWELENKLWGGGEADA